MATPITVVSSNFLAPNPVILIMYTALLDKNLIMTVHKVNGTDRPDIFQVHREPMSLRDHLTLVDAARNPILSFRRQLITSSHKRWVVFKGKSSDSNDILFSAKRSSLIQQKRSIDVFLARNKNEDLCDFKVIRNSSLRLDDSCTIYSGNGATIIAQTHKVGAFNLDTYNVTVYPNVDQAFVVALVVILHEINIDAQDGQQLQFTGSAHNAAIYACSTFVFLHLLLYFMHKW
ncbi:hypothetical protein SSX86_007314 [Deinandra increscens subsp. villosa]|uniref:Uncharacterized protein n=1 Tax=Deinandra increscens subsp. villosa TaxID=3103831 RepID=A0AAP0DHZ1_9ASTR